MRTLLRLLFLTLSLISSAHAQLRLPTLQVPPLPLQPLAVDPLLNQTAGRAATTLRRATVERLIRGNRKLLEADPDGEAVVRNEVLGISLTAEALSFAAAKGFTIVRERQVDAADLNYVVLSVPAGLSTRAALRLLREADPAGLYDYDHLYQSSGEPAAALAATPRARGSAVSIRVGLIDSGVEQSHPVFADSQIHTWGCGDERFPDAHGTAVASLLIAHHAAELFAADVYCRQPTGGSADSIATALGWLLEQHVAVINISLVGPQNQVVKTLIHAATSRGFLVVAAVGNDGPAAPPLYPAAYPGVIGVTAVDAQHRVLLDAGRGTQVMFAALGADISTASVNRGHAAVRGTSFAAPTVAALAAQLLDVPDRQAADSALTILIHRAVDLGVPGKDLTYGYGFLEAREESP